jgi:hypothetical protein
MRSLIKSLVPCGIILASLALPGNAAMAAAAQTAKVPTTQIHKSAKPTVHQRVARVTRPQAVNRAVGRTRYARTPQYFDVGQFIQSMLGGPLPPQYARIVQNAMRASASRRSATSGGTYDWAESPTYDTSSPPDTTGQDTAAAALAEDQAIQEMNDNNAMVESMQAAEEENDEANAETQQTLINNGM